MRPAVNTANPSIGFIGLGALGKGLSLALAERGRRVVGVHSRTTASAEWVAQRIEGCQVFARAQDLCDQADLVFVTTPDGVISRLVEEISWRSGQGVVHCCGAASEEILEPAAKQGAVTAAFHPCQTFACLSDPGQALERLRGVTFAVAGNGWVADFLRRLALDLGGDHITVPDGRRPLYHAASVMACGQFVALLRGAVQLWEGMGFTQEEAVQALYPLCRSTLDNVAGHGLTASATGPVMRGDTATVKTHLEALGDGFKDLIAAYVALTRESLPIAKAKGLADSQIDEMRFLIDGISQAASDDVSNDQA